jgi:hypothetical protein
MVDGSKISSPLKTLGFKRQLGGTGQRWTRRWFDRVNESANREREMGAMDKMPKCDGDRRVLGGNMGKGRGDKYFGLRNGVLF